jgi:hypothetical protein
MVNLLMDHAVERDMAAFELLRGQTAVLIRQRLKLEAGDDEEDEEGRPVKQRGNGAGAWMLYKEVRAARVARGAGRGRTRGKGGGNSKKQNQPVKRCPISFWGEARRVRENGNRVSRRRRVLRNTRRLLSRGGAIVQVKAGKKTKRGQREPVFYYNTVTRMSSRKKPPDYAHDPLHIPKKAMFGMHFYH